MYIYLFFKFYLSTLYTQPGAWAHNPEINSRVLLQLSQPGAPEMYMYHTSVFGHISTHICISVEYITTLGSVGGYPFFFFLNQLY